MKRPISLLEWILVDVILLSACYLVLDLLADLRNMFPLVAVPSRVLGFPVLILTIYFSVQLFHHLKPLKEKFDDDWRLRIEAKHAPISLGLRTSPIDPGCYHEYHER